VEQFEEQLEQEFRKELAQALEGTGLGSRFDCNLPAVLVPEDVLPGGAGYWIGYGLQHWPSVPAVSWPTFLWASYCSENDEPQSGRPLDVVMMDASARNPHLAAAMVVTEVLADVARRRAARAGDGDE
jgi:hypothetical protein